MLDALKKRLAEIETAHKAIPAAAIAIANKLRADVRRGRRQRAAAAKLAGVKPTKRSGSGVPILVVAESDQVRISASRQVHHIGHANGEPEEWAEIFGRKVVDRAKGGR